jgi:hypothetical protein
MGQAIDTFTSTMCACGRWFNGRDVRRVEQHYIWHTRRCSAGRRWTKDWRRRRAARSAAGVGMTGYDSHECGKGRRGGAIT